MNDNFSPETVSPKTLYNVLFVCTSSNGFAYNKGLTGLWLEELAIPYYIFQEVGYNITISTINGGNPPVDQACYHPFNMNEHVDKFLNDIIVMESFNSAVSLRSIINSNKISNYGCIFLCGGHGAVSDFPNNQDIKDAVEYVYNINEGCVAAICHGPLGLLNCLNRDGTPLLMKKFVAGFSNEEETLLGLEKVVPLLVEDSLDNTGAICVPSPPWHPNAVVDGRLVTGQNQQSSLEVLILLFILLLVIKVYVL